MSCVTQMYAQEPKVPKDLYFCILWEASPMIMWPILIARGIDIPLPLLFDGQSPNLTAYHVHMFPVFGVPLLFAPFPCRKCLTRVLKNLLYWGHGFPRDYISVCYVNRDPDHGFHLAC